MRPMSGSDSAGQRLRAALETERPLQVVGAINAFSALLAEQSGFRGDIKHGAEQTAICTFFLSNPYNQIDLMTPGQILKQFQVYTFQIDTFRMIFGKELLPFCGSVSNRSSEIKSPWIARYKALGKYAQATAGSSIHLHDLPNFFQGGCLVKKYRAFLNYSCFELHGNDVISNPKVRRNTRGIIVLNF